MSFDFAEYRKQKAERLARGEKKYPDTKGLPPEAPAAPETPAEPSPAAPVLETTKLEQQ